MNGNYIKLSTNINFYLLKVQFIIVSKIPRKKGLLEQIAVVVVLERSTNKAQNTPILSVNTDFKSGMAACFTTTCSEVDLAPEVILRSFSKDTKYFSN